MPITILLTSFKMVPRQDLPTSRSPRIFYLLGRSSLNSNTLWTYIQTYTKTDWSIETTSFNITNPSYYFNHIVGSSIMLVIVQDMFIVIHYKLLKFY